VDKALLSTLAQGRKILGLPEAPAVDDALLRYADELLRWNQKVNLTAVTDPAEVVEKHLLDSLAVLPEVAGATTLLDLGAGAGLPGVVLALSSPALSVTTVDAVAKKIGFVKHAAATLGLAGRLKAVHVRAEGQPEKEGLARAEVVISRAFMDAERFVPLAAKYVAPGGRIVAMLGKVPASYGPLEPESVRTFELPFSKAPRAVAVFKP
jgi:16S rRNA (guanine527-N7)-methyltransferase